MQLNSNFPARLYLDTKVLVNGKNKKPRDLNLEKYIELGDWIRQMLSSGAISTTETPLTANDSTTIDFTTSGTSNHTLTASVIIAALISADEGNTLILGDDGKLYVDLSVITEIINNLITRVDELETSVSILSNTVNNLIEQVNACCPPTPLDINFDNAVVQLCTKDITFPESIMFEITLNAAGADYGSFYTLVQAKFITPTGVPNTYNTTVYSYPQGLNMSGGNPNFVFSAGQNTALIADGGTVEFLIEYLDTSNVHHFGKLTAVVPNNMISNDDCEFNIPLTFEEVLIP